jgi:hypothetical protein
MMMESEEATLHRLATNLQGLRGSLSKHRDSARKAESLRKRVDLPGEKPSDLFASHVAIIGQILAGIATINQNRDNVERARAGAEKLLGVARSLN